LLEPGKHVRDQAAANEAAAKEIFDPLRNAIAA
jgi:hypothetical protein